MKIENNVKDRGCGEHISLNLINLKWVWFQIVEFDFVKQDRFDAGEYFYVDQQDHLAGR